MEIMLGVVVGVVVFIVVSNAVLMTWLLWRYRNEQRQRSADDEPSRAGQRRSDDVVWLRPRLHG
ncbi:MAG: hypothetical protein JWR27_1425 [Aeromicrobium sp.]|nr:hypothetical protein [Aeromicrobium sp.]